MVVAVCFFSRLVIWTAILAVFFALVLLLTGSTSLSGALTGFMVLGGLAVVLAAFPAGIAVSRDVLGARSARWRPFVAFAAATGALAFAVLLLVGWVGPSVVRATQGPGDATDLVGASRAMTLSDLRVAATAAIERAGADSATPPDQRWQPANILVWGYVRRLAAIAQPVLFAWIGLLAGFWAPRVGRRDLEQAQYWALGLFLVVSTYLAGENSFELVAMRAAGPAFFAGWFVLVIPAILIIGLGWPTAMVLWGRPDARHEP